MAVQPATAEQTSRGTYTTSVQRSRLRELAHIAILLLVTLAALFIAYQSTASYSIDIAQPGSSIELEGAYAPEHNEQFGSYRWTPGEVTIHLRPVGAPLKVQVRLAGWRDAGYPNPKVKLSLDGREAASVQTSNDPQEVTVNLHPGQAIASGFDLRLSTATFKYPGDPRDLGVVLMGVRAVSEPAWPAPVIPNSAPLLQVAVCVLLIYAGVRAAGSRRAPATLFAAAAAVLFAAILGSNRALFAQWAWLCVVVGLVAAALGAYWGQLVSFSQVCAATVRGARVPRWEADDVRGQGAVNYKPLTTVLVAAAAAITLLQLASAWLPQDNQPYTNFRWGLDFYNRLPGWVAWSGAIIVLLFAMPAVNSRVRGFFGPVRAYIAGANPYVLLLICGVAASVVLWLLRAPVSHGDSPELLQKIARGDKWHEREPLDYYIHYKLGQALAGWGIGPLQVYQVLSVLAGGLAVIGIVMVAWLLAPSGRRWVVAGFGLATANLALFAGYVESYTLVTVTLIWFLLVVLLYLRGAAPAAIPALALATAMWLHPSSAFLAPALAAGLLLRPVPWVSRLRDAAVMLAVGLLVSVVVAAIFLAEGYSWERWQIARYQLGGIDPGMFKPLLVATGAHEYYPLLSWAHLGGIIQQQLLLAPLALLTCIAAALAMRHPPVRERLKRARPQLLVLTAAAATAFLFSITWNPDFGAQKDWDLLALPGIPLALLAGALLANAWPSKVSGSDSRLDRDNSKLTPETSEGATALSSAPALAYVGSVLVVASAWHALAWILANAG